MSSIDDPLVSLNAKTIGGQFPRAEWNDTSREYPKGHCVHELFEAQVERTPDATALIYEAQALTYRELNERSNQVAHYLHSMGVGPEKVVGLCMQRSIGMVVAFLGILKASGAYLPVDPDYPLERIKYMLLDAMPVLVLVEESEIDAADSGGTHVIALKERWDDIRIHKSSNLPRSLTSVESQHVAYLIYTSGSTGHPKCVMAEHEGVVNGLSGQASVAPFPPSDVCCQKTSIAFVDSIFEILGPLLAGASLVIAPPMTSRDSSQLAAFIASNGITRLVTVPSLAQALMEQPQSAAQLASLRTWILSGEALGARLLEQLRRELPACCVMNVYGSSEVSAFVTAYVAEGCEDGPSAPIGRPLHNVQVHILDGELNPLPIGGVGEIFVAGVSLARGYLKRPRQTAARFIPDPFSALPNARIYRSGDLGRWRPDGCIEYVGRNDHQVKLRGYRIELGEIEAVLITHAQVKEAAVLLREGPPGEKRLVAYITCVDGARVTPEGLRAHLGTALPHYMVPAIFVLLDALPHTVNGKIDRRQLPAPDDRLPVANFSPPTSSTEQVLASIWSEVLQREQVGSEDDFFALGGHSLLAVRLMSKISERLLVTVTLPELFASPTVKALANHIDLLLLARQLRLAVTTDDDGQGTNPSADAINVSTPG